MRRLLKEFVRDIILNEAENDAKYLEKINFRKLHQLTPDADPKELQRKAKAGPIFSSSVLGIVEDIFPHQLPQQNAKEFIKWLATDLTTLIPSGMAPQNSTVQYVSEWIDGADIKIKDLPKSFWEADKLAQRWHGSLRNGTVNRKIQKTGKENIVYEFSDGYRILKLSPRECKSEGFAMTHCVGGYSERIRTGDMSIFSLRDPDNTPHVTISLVNVGSNLDQIKGPNNAAPLPDDAKRIKEWLKTTDFDVSESDDFFKMLSKEEMKQLFIEAKSKEDGGRSALLLLRKLLYAPRAGFSRRDFTKISLGISFSVVHLVAKPEETERQLEIIRAGTRNLVTWKEMDWARRDINNMQHGSLASGAARACIIAAIRGAAADSIFWALKTDVLPSRILRSIEAEIGETLEDFLFREDREENAE